MTKRYIKRTIAAFGVMAMTAGGGIALTAGAASPSETECLASGGTFTKVRGEVSCVTVDPVGNSEASGGKSQTRDTDTTGRGNIDNKQQTECSGPGNSNNC